MTSTMAYAREMTGPSMVMSRRTFLRDLGHGAFAVAAFGLAGCLTSPAPSTQPPFPTLPGGGDPLTYDGNLQEIERSGAAGTRTHQLWRGPRCFGAAALARFGGGFSSGYVLVRGGEATVVDTGQWCVPTSSRVD